MLSSGILSRENRRRRKEQFLQKIGAHAGTESASWLDAAKGHSELAERVNDTHRALGDYRMALEALGRAGVALAEQLRGLSEAAGSTDGKSKWEVEKKAMDVTFAAALVAYREVAEGPFQALGKNRIADFTSRRKAARLDFDSFNARQDDRADDAKARLESLTTACEAEFREYREKTRSAVLKATAGATGCQAFLFDRLASANADLLLSEHPTSAASAMVLASLHETHLDRAYGQPDDPPSCNTTIIVEDDNHFAPSSSDDDTEMTRDPAPSRQQRRRPQVPTRKTPPVSNDTTDPHCTFSLVSLIDLFP